LTYATSESAFLQVDTKYPNTVGGRNSVRIQSNNTYNDGLFIFDILHTPFGCGTWPALWLSDSSNWPMNGEIDVVEAVNNGTWGNSMTLHTTDDCSMKVKRKETGSVTSSNCYNGTNSNEGCGVQGSTASYGPEFNKNGGGVRTTTDIIQTKSMLTACPRFMLLSFEMLESASGGSRETLSHPTSPAAAQTLPPGVRPQPTFPAPTAASHHISKTKVSLPTSICAGRSLDLLLVIPTRHRAPATAPTTLRKTPARSTTPIGSLRVSRFTKPLEQHFYTQAYEIE
jgi:hypothetical protein